MCTGWRQATLALGPIKNVRSVSGKSRSKEMAVSRFEHVQLRHQETKALVLIIEDDANFKIGSLPSEDSKRISDNCRI